MRQKYLQQIEQKIDEGIEAQVLVTKQKEALQEDQAKFQTEIFNLEQEKKKMEEIVSDLMSQLEDLNSQVELKKNKHDRLINKIDGQETIIEEQTKRMEEFDEDYLKIANQKKKLNEQYLLMQDRIRDAENILKIKEKKQNNSEKMIKEAESNLKQLRKELNGMEKSIRLAESRIQEQLTLTRIRKFAKIFGGAIFIIGLILFIAGLLSSLITFQFSDESFTKIIASFLIISGILIFTSGLMHMNT